MAGLIKTILKISTIAVLLPQIALSAQAPNPRAGNASNVSSRSVESDSNASIRRSATSVIARSTAVNNRKNHRVVTARSGVSRAATNNVATVSRSARTPEKVVTNKSGLSRSAKKTANTSRSAVVSGIKKLAHGGFSRAASSRATAVFNDVSKIGGGYGSCRDAYATCMDQFCANANDTYRRCYCSDRFTEFRDTADNLDTVLKMLAEFQDNNLNAVDKTAAEVNAMYSASAGEAAIKRDTSASQQLLDSIGDVLSGKKKNAAPEPKTMGSMGVLDLSGFSAGVSDDIFGSSNSSSVFGGGNDTGVDMTTLEGKDLYNQANSQCSEVIREACKGDALFNMAKSAYSIMITQDCNAYQKNIDAKKTSVEETVRTAEKYLREARLEEYRAHNSQDVNDCLSKVENAMLQPTACGENYKRCLDYSGLYINPVDGEPIYSKALLNLNSLIILDGSADIPAANPKFDSFLEEKKIFANTALDGCRDLADTVWYEFKRMAIIQIAQAQDAKIEEVKSGCVETMKECYDEQSGALENFAGDGAAGSSTGALSAIAAHDMCKDKVLACAALFGDPDGCKYDDATKKLTQVAGKQCGLTSLLNFVNTVDSVKVAEGCENSLTEYAKELCTPTDDEGKKVGYPWKCRLLTIGAGYETDDTSSLYGMLKTRATNFCGDVEGSNASRDSNEPDTALKTAITDSKPIIEKLVQDIKDNLAIQSQRKCESTDSETEKGINGVWMGNASIVDLLKSQVSGTKTNKDFYAKYFNGMAPANTEAGLSAALTEGFGFCAENTTLTACLAQNNDPDKSYAEYEDGECKFKEEWYSQKCISAGGYMEGDTCYLPLSATNSENTAE